MSLSGGLEDFIFAIENNSRIFTGPRSRSRSRSLEEIATHDTEILLNTFVFYGSFLIIVFVVFCGVRQLFPRPFTVRKWSTKEGLKVRL
jgi:hypothetical protein